MRGSSKGAWSTLVRGLRLSPELKVGLGVTLLLALGATAGRVIVPIAVQQVVDRGLGQGEAAGGRVAASAVAGLGAAALLAVAVTALAGFLMSARLARTTETALANLRVRAFRHLHDLSALHLAGEQRGALVSRVTADIDIISQFMQWGGVLLLVNLGQLLLATAVMAFYSWQLTLVVLVVFTPLALVLRWFQGRLGAAYDLVRVRVGAMLGALGESVAGADVIRAYGVQERTRERVDGTIDRQFHAAYRAARLGGFMFASGEVFAAVATAGAVVIGVLLGVGGGLSQGELLAFLFLVTLFVGPVQLATEVLDQAQTAIAGWRRVLDLLETEPDVADPPDGVDLPAGPAHVRFRHVGFAYPERAEAHEDGGDGQGAHRADGGRPEAHRAGGGRPGLGAPVLVDVDLAIAPRTRVAIVGETGSGKSTFAKLLTRLVDPTDGAVEVNGVDVRRARFASLRHRVLLVPQEGFLFDSTVEENVRYGRPGISREEVATAFERLGLADWLGALPHGLATAVGERGEQLSAGERQLVALARAYVADPELLVLDEATSAVDPATEARLARALEALARGRTSVTIAHRLSTARDADEVLVLDAGRLVQRGTHAQLVSQTGVYARLHASWAAGSQRRRTTV